MSGETEFGDETLVDAAAGNEATVAVPARIDETGKTDANAETVVEARSAADDADADSTDVDAHVAADADADADAATVVETVMTADDTDEPGTEDSDDDKPLDPDAFFALLRASTDSASEVASDPANAATEIASPAPAFAPVDSTSPTPAFASVDFTSLAPPPPSAFGGPMPYGPPAAPYMGPMGPYTGPMGPMWGQPPAKPKGRMLRNVLRWTSAVIVLGAVGAGTAYAVTLPKRTNIPTLATKNDGRYLFPSFAKPPLPAGGLAPGDPANKSQSHYGDLREYLLKEPAGAVADKAYPALTGWVQKKDFCAPYADPDSLCGALDERGLRKIAATGWTGSDGTHTTIWLLQFPDNQAAMSAVGSLTGEYPTGFGDETANAPQLTVYLVGPPTQPPGDTVNYAVYARAPKPGSQTADPKLTGRIGVVALGDTVELVQTVGPKAVTDVPTEQVITLQAEILR